MTIGTFDGIERETGPGIGLAMIWLHGLGADAGDFVPMVDALQLPAPTRFVFPNAPVRPVTINGGMRMRAWYDITGFGPDAAEDRAGLQASADHVRGLIEREVERGVPRERIFVAGFSQGGAVVQHAGLTGAGTIGGVLGLSTYLPAAALVTGSDELQAGVPVWLAHGTHDPVIPLMLAEHSAGLLRKAGLAVDWSVYPMAHEVCTPEIAALNAWLVRQASR